jgi:hypothetical protein
MTERVCPIISGELLCSFVQDANRYQKIKKMTDVQVRKLYEKCFITGVNFDALLDKFDLLSE